MSMSEIIPGVYCVRGKFADEFGYLTSYLVVSGDHVLVIDPGTAGDPGEETIKAIESLGLNYRSDVVAILCTHGHPDHIGGAGRLQKQTNAPILIHSADAELLTDPQSFVKKRLRLDFAGRFAMKLEKGPIRVNYRPVQPERFLKHGEKISVGSVQLRVIHTGGHSAGHCVFYESDRKILFSGDEINNFPNDPRKFYIDLSGSFTARKSAIDILAKLGTEYLLSSHDIAHLMSDASLQFDEVRSGHIHFQDTVLRHLSARGDADIEQLVFDIHQSRSIPIPFSMDTLLSTTLQVCLEDLVKAGLVRANDDKVWSVI
ncbi:MAG: MBL fold metallo-hydrolase [Candidatus Thorarchaeota archaeon]